jgi:cell division protein FtsZ
VLINIVGGPDLKMREIQEAASLVQEQAHEDANIIFGASIDEALGENVKVTVIATGFDTIERMAALGEGTRLSVPAGPQTIPSMHAAGYHEARQHIPQQAPQHAGHGGHPSQRPVFQGQPFQQQPQASRATEAAPTFSSRRIPAPEGARVVPASTRIPARERASANFPAFDTDWDVPAFQRKGGS